MTVKRFFRKIQVSKLNKSKYFLKVRSTKKQDIMNLDISKMAGLFTFIGQLQIIESKVSKTNKNTQTA